MSAERSEDRSIFAMPESGIPAISAWFSTSDGAEEGGDWCGSIVRPDGIVALTIGDVSGHGAGVAESMRSVRTSVFNALRFAGDPSEALAIANDFVFDRLEGCIVTAVVALVDPDRRSLRYANAGHPPPLLVTERQTSYLWQSSADLPLGIFPRHESRTYLVDLSSESLFLLYTDGITEHARDAIRGEAELIEAARSVYENEGVDDARAIAEAMLAGTRGHDDAATMALRFGSRTVRDS